MQKKGAFEEALRDGEKSVQINSKWGKGFQRKGVALHNLRRFEEAVEAFKMGLKLEPENTQIKVGLEEAESALEWEQEQKQSSGTKEGIFKVFADLFKGDVIERVRSMPEISQFADDKDFVRKIEMIKADPSKISEYLQDDKIKTYLTAALQYQTLSQMSPQERANLVQKQEEVRQKKRKSGRGRKRAKEEIGKGTKRSRRKKEERRRTCETYSRPKKSP